jgi:alcohol dehydrogenase class IV
LILRSIDLAINSKDKGAMQAMSLASHLSGKAINITKTTAPHAISYTLTLDYNIPHGYAVASLLAPVAYVSFNKGDSRYKDTLNEIFELFGCKSIDEFCVIWKQLMQKFGLHLKLEDSNITLNELDYIVDNTNVERLKGHPVLLSKSDLEQIVRMAITGY